ncbi:MAG: 16S rRNA (cytosine(967)-C(5))-methyltransferase RsmB [Gammaproteobacteria bacterium]|nr:16S rRNA (cytosine(967)-C(5))-methyltransferase RsmB [Gammaproteobacteria bacterium]MBT8133854.1 16S rRNA (cytosine(967)-C(5))-methyltransferase RsmB [Gammaproteobacteria bacterium]NNJ51471.1 16S rRNA (cytosine(967)-C(5))-methyltransferase RsmB [Gammaproteobacteria bacterium]
MSKSKVSAARSAGLKALRQVFNGQSLSAVQPHTTDVLQDSRDRGLANELVNGVLRWRWQLEYFISCLLKKPLKAKDIDVQLILLMALYEMKECRTPDYAVINESVELVRKSGKKWAAGLVNAVLRNFTREKEKLITSIDDDSASYSHPQWLVEKIKADWPQHWRQIMQANNQRPAFWLRINQLQYSVEQYMGLLAEQGIEFDEAASSVWRPTADHALKLSHGIDVRLLPGFSEGALSVQDVGAQLIAELLDVREGDRVLDLCAAPGGKTCHILERYHMLDSLVAVEVDEQRMLRVSENLQRLKLGSRAELIVADARDPEKWWPGEKFHRILIDAPCSASGVIRRHPDIKTLRRDTDIEPLIRLQFEILMSAWQMLEPGGELLYVTCSIFRDENQNQIKNFLAKSADAREISIDMDWGEACEHGRQLLPGEHAADGFYYCRIKKAG